MTQNLRIVNKPISSEDSNLAEGATYTIPASSLWSDTSVTADKAYYAGNSTNGANYTWYTATASTQGSSYSICPRGWKLPTKGEYDTLKAKGTTKIDNISGDKFDGYNIGGAFFPTAGSVVNGSLNDVGSAGYYWSSTAGGSINAYRLSFSSNGVDTGTSNRYLGFSVRCITP